MNHFTIAAWIKTKTDFASIGYVINKGGSGSDIPGFNMNYGIWFTSSERLRGGFETVDGGDIFVTPSPNAYNDGKWHYVLLSYDGSLLSLYVDGTQISSKNTNGVIPDTTGDQPLRIGANALDESKFFTGNVEEVRVWNRALTDKEVKRCHVRRRLNTIQ